MKLTFCFIFFFYHRINSCCIEIHKCYLEALKSRILKLLPKLCDYYLKNYCIKTSLKYNNDIFFEYPINFDYLCEKCKKSNLNPHKTFLEILINTYGVTNSNEEDKGILLTLFFYWYLCKNFERWKYLLLF